MVWWRIPLYPFAIIYDLITRFRNHLYNIGSTPSFDFETNVISVGNLSMGGTGKTPMVTFLAKYFMEKDMKITILSRGYGRKTKGFRMVGSRDSAASVGDESLNYYKNFAGQVMVAVGENRALAIPRILWEQQDNELIILDDAFQHRSVIPAHSILLTRYDKPFFQDYVFPAGTLRESRKGAHRADMIVVTGCPMDLSGSEQQAMREQLRKFNEKAGLYFTTHRYHDIRPIFDKDSKKEKAILVAGIANPQGFIEDMKLKFHVQDVLEFPDHHVYGNLDISRIMQSMDTHHAMMICTEKDAVKLQEFRELQDYDCFSISYDHSFLEGETDFLEKLELCMKTYHRDYGAL